MTDILKVGDVHQMNGYTLTWTQLSNGYNVCSVDNLGFLWMSWEDLTWGHNLAQQKFVDIADAIASLQELSEQRERRSQEVEVISKNGDEYQVRSQNSDRIYIVNLGLDKHYRCTCPDTEYRGATCKHQRAVRKYELRKWESRQWDGLTRKGQKHTSNKYGIEVHKLEAELGMTSTLMEVSQSDEGWLVEIGGKVLHRADSAIAAQQWLDDKRFHGSLSA